MRHHSIDIIDVNHAVVTVYIGPVRKSGHVFKRGALWVIRIQDSETIVIGCKCERYICGELIRDCPDMDTPQSRIDHMRNFCHGIHGIRVLRMAISMLGGVRVNSPIDDKLESFDKRKPPHPGGWSPLAPS